MKEKKQIMLLSSEDIHPILFKSKKYAIRRLIYFDAIFEHLTGFEKNEINKISTIIIDEKLFKGNDFFKMIKLLNKITKKINIIVILKGENNIMKEKLLNLGIKKVYFEPLGCSLDMTEVVVSCMADPLISNYIQNEEQELLKEIVFKIKKNENKNLILRIKKKLQVIKVNIFNRFLKSKDIEKIKKEKIIKFDNTKTRYKKTGTEPYIYNNYNKKFNTRNKNNKNKNRKIIRINQI